MTITVRTIFSINATDRSHDFLVIRRGPAGISIEAQSREDEWESATAGPFTPEQLRAALDEVAPAGSYTRTDEQPRPLTADAIESVLHDILPLTTEHLEADDIANIASDLYLALTEPTRPEGAEELNELIGEYLDSTPGVDDKGMADFLAERGVRVVTEEQP